MQGLHWGTIMAVINVYMGVLTFHVTWLSLTEGRGKEKQRDTYTFMLVIRIHIGSMVILADNSIVIYFRYF
jgi:hypothetical protein